MEYIKSRDIFILMRETMKLIYPRLIDHGSRVAYMVYKMLEHKGGYEEFELADIVMVATFHDIGAYRTEADALNDMLRYESRDSRAHTIYGYLFFKYLSPVEELAKVIMYHHTDYEQLKKVNYPYKDLAAYINIAEKMDIYFSAMGSQFNMHMFNKQAGAKLSEEGLNLFYETAEKEDIFIKIKTGDYKDELDNIIDYMIFSNEDKKKFLEMIMYCFGFHSETAIMDTINSVHVCMELAERLSMRKVEKERLYYGALLHDIGMTAIPRSIVEAPRILNSEELKKIRMHVDISEKVLNGMLREDVTSIILRHHERGDGSGYPKKLRASQMNLEQKVLQVVDTVIGMTNKRTYREPLHKEQVIEILNEEAANNHLDGQVVGTLVNSYDEIMKKVHDGSADFMKMYQTLSVQYDQVSERYKI